MIFFLALALVTCFQAMEAYEQTQTAPSHLMLDYHPFTPSHTPYDKLAEAQAMHDSVHALHQAVRSNDTFETMRLGAVFFFSLAILSALMAWSSAYTKPWKASPFVSNRAYANRGVMIHAL
jgi:hypothetical protein